MTAGPGHPLPERLRKRDGQVVRFDPQRIMAAVQRAQEAVGEQDPGLPLEVAELVVLTLAGRAERGRREQGTETFPTPSVEQVQDLVEEALVGLGRTRVARAYILYRDRRARARTALVVGQPGARQGAPQVRGEAGSRPWNRARIAAALVREAGVPSGTAEEVARRVERGILALGAARVSSGLVRAFVDQELESMGLFDAARASEAVGLPRPDLRSLLRASREDRRATDERYATPAPAHDRRAGGALLSRWALQDVLGDTLASAHHGGSMLVLGLERPHLPLVRAVRAQGLGDGGAARAMHSLVGLLEGSAQGVVLEGIGELLGSPKRGADTERTVDLLASLGALSQASGRRLDLGDVGGRGPRQVVRVLTALVHGLAAGIPMPKLFLDHEGVSLALEEEPSLAEGVEELLTRSHVVPVWAPEGERFAGPALVRRHREKSSLTLGGAVALDLAALARRAGPWHEEAFLAGIVEQVPHLVEALKRMARAQEEYDCGLPVGRLLHAVVPVGLSDALRVLGDGVARSDQGARALGVLREAAQREAEREGLLIELSTLLSGTASEVLARREVRRSRHSQAGLFGAAPLPESERVEAYRVGFDLGSGHVSHEPRDRGRALAGMAATLPSGALWPLHDPLTSQRGGLACLTTWQAFEEERLRLLEPRSVLVPRPSPGTAREVSLPFGQEAHPSV